MERGWGIACWNLTHICHQNADSAFNLNRSSVSGFDYALLPGVLLAVSTRAYRATPGRNGKQDAYGSA